MSAAQRSLPNVAFIARRAAWFAGFLGLIAAAIATTGRFDLGVIPIVAFLILPDLGLLPGIGQPHEKRQNLVLDRDVQSGRWFVSQEQAGIGGDRDRDHDALGHPPAELVRVVA